MSRTSRLLEHLRAWKQGGRSPSPRQSRDTRNRLRVLQAEGQPIEPATGPDDPDSDDLRQVALDLLRRNDAPLIGAARLRAATRAEALTSSFLHKLQRVNPDGFRQANDPGFQHALHIAQNEQARSGDSNLADLLIDLLIDRSQQERRDLLQIVLDESLRIAPKLTEPQLANLAAIFFLRYTQNNLLGTHESLGENLDRFLAPLIGMLTTSTASFQHLEFAGCGTMVMAEMSLEEQFSRRYQGLFMKGFEASAIVEQGLRIGNEPHLFIPCLNDTTKLQVKALNLEGLEASLNNLGIDGEDKTKIRELFGRNTMSLAEIRQTCISHRSYMADVFDFWSESPARHFTLTSAGIALGHTTIRRHSGAFADLSLWIHEQRLRPEVASADHCTGS